MAPVIPIVIQAVVTAAVSAAVGFVVNAIAGSKRQTLGIGPNVTAPDRSYGLNGDGEEARAGPLSVRAEPGGALIGIFGRRRVGGRVIFSGQSEENDKNYLIVAIAGAPLDAIEAVFMENQQVILNGAGDVTTPPWTNGSVNIALYDGTQTAVDPVMKTAFPGYLDDADEGRYLGERIAYARIQINQTLAPAAFQTGTPDFTFMVRGFKCYDPRNSAQSLADPATWTFSENAAIINANYLIHELGAALDPAFIDWGSVADAASICDEIVPLKDGNSEPRYSCAAFWTTDERHEDVLSRIGISHAGGMFLVGKSYRAFTGAFTQSSAHITPDDYEADGISWSDAPPISALVNGVRGTFSSPFHNYEPRDFPSYQDAAALAEDGRESWLDLDLSAVTSPFQAQRLARIAYNKARHGFPASVDLQFTHFDTVADDVISITDEMAGFDIETFRVTGDRLIEGFVVSLDLERELASFYAWNPATDERPFVEVGSIYGSTSGENLQTTGSAAGDTGALVPPGGALVDAHGTAGTYRPRCVVWLSPNISPAATYRFRLSYSVDSVNRSTADGSELSRKTNTGTLEVTGAGPNLTINTDMRNNVLDGGGFGFYTYKENWRITSALVRSERSGAVSAWRTMFSGNSPIATFDGLVAASSPYFTMPVPCAPYAVSFAAGLLTFKTNFVDSPRAETIQFYGFASTALVNPVHIASVANSAGGAQATLSKAPGEFAYIRARTLTGGTASPWSNWLLVTF